MQGDSKYLFKSYFKWEMLFTGLWYFLNVEIVFMVMFEFFKKVF